MTVYQIPIISEADGLTANGVVVTNANKQINAIVGTTGEWLKGVTSGAPVWSTSTLADSWTKGDLVHASAANVLTGLAAVAVGQVLISAGTGTAPAWSVDLPLTSATTAKPVVTLTNTNADAASALINFVKDSASPAANDDLGAINFYGDNAGAVQRAFVAIRAESSVVTAGAEEGTLTFTLYNAGASAAVMTIKGTYVGIGGAPESPYVLGVTGQVNFQDDSWPPVRCARTSVAGANTVYGGLMVERMYTHATTHQAAGIGSGIYICAPRLAVDPDVNPEGVSTFTSGIAGVLHDVSNATPIGKLVLFGCYDDVSTVVQHMVILPTSASASYVGINIPSGSDPAAPLEVVVDGSNTDDLVAMQLQNWYAGNSGVFIKFGNSASHTAQGYFGVKRVGSTTGDFVWKGGDGVEQLRLTSGGTIILPNATVDPTAHIDNKVILYSAESGGAGSYAGATLCMYLQTQPIPAAETVSTHKLLTWINGVKYGILLVTI